MLTELPVLEPAIQFEPALPRNPSDRSFAESSYAILRLSPSEDDPVRIIQAAQIQLRRWRQVARLAPSARWRDHVGEIIAARDALLGIDDRVTAPREGVHSAHGGRSVGSGAELQGCG
jgi:hypothetical protein